MRRGLPPLPLLTIINFLNYFDRQIMFGLYPLIKADMHLTDTQLGWLATGNLLVFAISSVLSGPATKRFGTRVVVASGVAAWSLATLGSAIAPNFAILLVMRALVGIGEGAFGPSANALLCADAPPDKRGRAMGIYNVGMALGGAGGGSFALIAGASLSWRGTLLIAGVPGLVMAFLALRMAVPASIDAQTRLPARRYLLSTTYIVCLLGGILGTFGASALIVWMPTLLVRERLMANVQAGIYILFVAIVCGAGGVLAGGYGGDALSRRARGGHALMVGVSFVIGMPFGIMALFHPSIPVFLVLTAIAAFLFSVYNGPIAAAVDDLGPRAYATTLQAYFLLFIHLCGNTPAPVVIGKLSDMMQGKVAAPLAVALVAAMTAFLLSGLFFIVTARRQRREPPHPA